MSITANNDIKTLISEALYGNIDMKESIEKLSEILFPGENLIDQIRNQKIINDVNAKIASLKEKSSLELLSIKKEDTIFEIAIQFNKINDFLSEQQKVMAHLSQVSKTYSTKLNITFVITQLIS